MTKIIEHDMKNPIMCPCDQCKAHHASIQKHSDPSLETLRIEPFEEQDYGATETLFGQSGWKKGAKHEFDDSSDPDPEPICAKCHFKRPRISWGWLDVLLVKPKYKDWHCIVGIEAKSFITGELMFQTCREKNFDGQCCDFAPRNYFTRFLNVFRSAWFDFCDWATAKHEGSVTVNIRGSIYDDNEEWLPPPLTPPPAPDKEDD